jgi:hypothetical protein
VHAGLNPVIWYAEELQEVTPGSGKYLASKSAPIYGWTGFLIELIWEYPYVLLSSSSFACVHSPSRFLQWISEW